MAHSISPASSDAATRGVGAAPTGERHQEAGLAVEERRGLPTLRGAAGAQLREGQRVDRARGDTRVDGETLETGSQLAGGPAGEGHGEHPSRVERPGRGLPGDPPGQDPGLARAGPGEHRQRRGVADDRGALVVVEADEDRVGVHDSDGTDGV